jgi:hypothetical protein
MAFGNKMQDVFTVLVRDIKELGSQFDFFKEAKALEKYLKDMGLSIKAPQFIADLFDELEYPRSGWKPNKDDLTAFFKILPDRIKKEKITNDILVKHVPKEDWGKFKEAWASARSQIKKGVGNLPLLLSKQKGDETVVSVFLGDITERLGIRKSELKGYTYKHIYSTVDEVIGRDVILAKVQEKLKGATVRLLDYPNASCLHDARYEFSIRFDKVIPMAEILSKVVVIKALQEIGVA